MFGLFKKKKTNNENLVIEIASNLITTQLAFSHTSINDLIVDEFALGYIYGFHCTFLMILKITDKNRWESIILESYSAFIPNPSVAKQAFGMACNLVAAKHKKCVKGLNVAKDDSIKFMDEKITPMSLAKHLREESKLST